MWTLGIIVNYTSLLVYIHCRYYFISCLFYQRSTSGRLNEQLSSWGNEVGSFIKRTFTFSEWIVIRFPSLNLIKKRGAISMTTRSVGTSHRVGAGSWGPGVKGEVRNLKEAGKMPIAGGWKGTKVWVFRKPVRLVELLETMYRGLSRFVENTVIWEIKCMICKLKAYVVGRNLCWK